MLIHTICLSNKELSPVKEFMVTSPAPRIGTMDKIKIQSRVKKLLRIPTVLRGIKFSATRQKLSAIPYK